MEMNWSKDRSILLSMVCLLVFALLLLALDAGCYWIARRYFVEYRGDPRQYVLFAMVSVYSGSVLGWITLWKLWGLLARIRRGEVFVPRNVAAMRAVSWCCAGAAAVCLLSALYYFPFLFIAVAAAFMALIVRIVKNAFQQAVAMKRELDLTV